MLDLVHDGNYDEIPISLPSKLYDELMACEVDSYDEGENASQHQFCQAMLKAEKQNRVANLIITEDGLVYLMNVALPTNMEMWYTWNNTDGKALITQAKRFLDAYNVSYPY